MYCDKTRLGFHGNVAQCPVFLQRKFETNFKEVPCNGGIKLGRGGFPLFSALYLGNGATYSLGHNH